MFIKNRKANVFTDVLIMVVVLFVLAIGLGAVSMIAKEIMPEIKAELNQTGNITAQAAEILDDQENDTGTIWDGIILFLFVGMWLAALVGSFLIDTNPVFFIIVVLILVPVVITGAVLGNVYEETSLESEYTQTLKNDFKYSYWIMTHMLAIAIIMGGTIAIVLYTKLSY